MEYMSFFATQEQVLNQTKFVTRRQGWNKIKVGDEIQPVIKRQGLKRGEKVQPIGCSIIITAERWELINIITSYDVVLEGFPNLSVNGFITMYCNLNDCNPTDICHRLQYKYTRQIGVE